MFHTRGHGASLGTRTLKASPDSPPKGVPPAPESGDPTPQSVPRLRQFWSNLSHDFSRDFSRIATHHWHTEPQGGGGESARGTEPSPASWGSSCSAHRLPSGGHEAGPLQQREEETRDRPAAPPGLRPTGSLPSDRPGSLGSSRPAGATARGSGEVTATSGTDPLLDGETEAQAHSSGPREHGLVHVGCTWGTGLPVPVREVPTLPVPGYLHLAGGARPRPPRGHGLSSQLCTRPTAAPASRKRKQL